MEQQVNIVPVNIKQVSIEQVNMEPTDTSLLSLEIPPVWSIGFCVCHISLIWMMNP
jgi:hypothetical protein